MEATLRPSFMPQAPSKKLHSLLTLHGSHTSFSPSCLRAKFHQAAVSCQAAPNSGNDNKPREVAVGVAAAAALACFLGFACARPGGAGAGGVAQYAWISWPPGTQVQQQHDLATPPPSSLSKQTMQHKYMEMRAELLQWLDDAKLKLKEHPGSLKMSDKGGATALFKEWESKSVGSHDKYELGLSLTEILIARGEYKLAERVCQEIERLSPPTDRRVPLRLFIIYASMQIEMLEKMVNKWNEFSDKYEKPIFLSLDKPPETTQ